MEASSGSRCTQWVATDDAFWTPKETTASVGNFILDESWWLRAEAAMLPLTPWQSCLRHRSGSWELHCKRGTHGSIFEVQTDWCGLTCANWSHSCDSHFSFYQIISDCPQIAASLCKSSCSKPICSKCLSCWTEHVILKCPCLWLPWFIGIVIPGLWNSNPDVCSPNSDASRLEASRSSPTWTFSSTTTLSQQINWREANKSTGGKHLYNHINCITKSSRQEADSFNIQNDAFWLFTLGLSLSLTTLRWKIKSESSKISKSCFFSMYPCKKCHIYLLSTHQWFLFHVRQIWNSLTRMASGRGL